MQIPRPAKTSEDSVSCFLRNKDASHIKNHGGNQISRKDGFNPLNAAENIVWEDARINRRRGAKDMSELELNLARTALVREGNLIFVKNAFFAGIKIGFVAGSLELPLITLEDYVARQGQVSVTVVGKSSVIAACFGCVSGAVLHAVCGLLPEPWLTSDQFRVFTLALGSLGTASYLWELSVRIKKAYEVKRPEKHLVTIVA